MKSTLISWGDVLERYEVTLQQLTTFCAEGLQVFDKEENKIFASCQCEANPIEQPQVVWGRIAFDMDQDELIFEEEFIENELFKIKFFPKTGDFILTRKDATLTIYNQNIFAHLMNVEFPIELTQEFFKRVHSAGNENYFPSDELKSHESIEAETYFKTNNIYEINMITTFEREICSSIIEPYELSIPYILRQKYNRSKKQCNMIFKLSKYNYFELISLNPRLKQKNILESQKIRIVQGISSSIDNNQDYFKMLNNKKLEIENKNLQILEMCIDGTWYFASTIECISENLHRFNLQDYKNNEYISYFNTMLFLMGYISYIPTTFEHEVTNSEEKVYDFHSIMSAVNENGVNYNEDEVARIKENFFFKNEDLEKYNFNRKALDYKVEFVNHLKCLHKNEENKKKKDSIMVAILKFDEFKKSVDIYDEMYPQDKYKEKGNKQKNIRDCLKRVEKMCTDVLTAFPKDRTEWIEYSKKPSDFLRTRWKD